jgi:hypothetical protein
MVDVLFVVGSGTAPALRSQQFNLFVPVNNRLVLVPMSFPVMTAGRGWMPRPSALTLEGRGTLPLASITSVDLMARRRLKDDMPAIMLRATVRATASAVAQYQAQRTSDRNNTAGLAAALVTIGSALVSSADDRTWRTLPAEISIARARIPAGVHSVTLQTPQGPRSASVNVGGRYAVIDFWLLGQQLYGYHPATKKGEAAR